MAQCLLRASPRGPGGRLVFHQIVDFGDHHANTLNSLVAVGIRVGISVGSGLGALSLAVQGVTLLPIAAPLPILASWAISGSGSSLLLLSGQRLLGTGRSHTAALRSASYIRPRQTEVHPNLTPDQVVGQRQPRVRNAFPGRPGRIVLDFSLTVSSWCSRPRRVPAPPMSNWRPARPAGHSLLGVSSAAARCSRAAVIASGEGSASRSSGGRVS